MLSPKRQKHRKQFRGIWRRIAVKGQEVNFGGFGIKSMSQGWITDRQIEACRVIMARATKKSGKFWIRIFPDKPFTKKPPEVTMGSGKGEVSHFVASVVPGRILFEIDGLTPEIIKGLHGNISAKLPIKTQLVTK
ncbi:50S ribosomal protein L16 [Candidatus Roizmanbacteria bacterium RIFCSPHIGHO2_02_FULL_40_13b]|uniref:50S ribosomal protein L16 n=1 Tax=Candidatus Roizmanbacteria bacterium RIFCSPHIGHO2_01_FULL_39_24 TaxID=1802032 RepID=A0A1F7GLA5_9BACT|nr:MAG: 50S ribosomal protein L16 [Candidatus Roizmanbacteria bacterium RIFCSPHIGHO2_01_FULL_39_24]OGK27808.1 MAG: 50S ribosomal protein L16 [Candidatus Roizmanbacteria bacterium RIFCSPHIGHO2_02_FULL_40_13b]OGK49950.1 MAG: 50S ribosomal protein L16 [Candidatus Roizmanbacteria bacterium RIFCSPLOWO2_01_FULL_40_32]OGK55955.1 MAG: 50S ribosomal protein L16 [Candidatus Roizmanbacteria bacterium RIFCSPLOWO2_02_FULL_39_8]